jgi:ATP synthase protein I
MRSTGATGAPGARPEPESQTEGAAKGLATGLRVVSELVAAVLVGCGVGYLLDRWLGTLPLFLMGFLLLGFAAGFLNVYRMGQPPRRKKPDG